MPNYHTFFKNENIIFLQNQVQKFTSTFNNCHVHYIKLYAMNLFRGERAKDYLSSDTKHDMVL